MPTQTHQTSLQAPVHAVTRNVMQSPPAVSHVYAVEHVHKPVAQPFSVPQDPPIDPLFKLLSMGCSDSEGNLRIGAGT